MKSTFCGYQWLSLGFLVLTSCSSSGGSGSFSAATTIRSSNLTTSVSTSLQRSDQNGAIVKAAVSGLNEATHPCPTGTTTCYSPVAMGGKFRSLNLRVSTDGQYGRIEIIPADTTTADNAITGAVLNSFDLGAPASISATASCCSGITFNGSSYFSDLNWTIGWIDAKFDNSTFGLGAGTSTLRFVYFDDDSLGYQKGDVLLKVGDDFKWCPQGTTTTGGCVSTRPATPITQNAGIVGYTPGSSDPLLPYLNAEISDSAAGTGRVTAAESDLSGSVSFTVDFDHEKAFAIESTSPALTTIFDVMPLLYLRGFSATPTGVSVSGGLSAVLTITR